MDELNEKIKRVFADLNIRCAYNMPSFWADGGKDYVVIPTRYAKGYQKALEDAEREITEVLSAQPEHLVKESGNLVKGLVNDCIRRQAAIDALRNRWLKTKNYEGIGEDIAEECEIYLRTVPSAQPERMTNRQWIDFLSAQFDISRTSAKEMLHGMMQWKKEDNFKKLFNGGKT